MTEEAYMREALRLAMNAVGRTSPNPMVGAVVVKDGRIVGAGWHRKAGTPHAEIHALRMAGELAKGATLFVTLEPCVHTGRTGPCTEAIIEAGISRVVAAMEDPNPVVSGRGLQKLREAGVETDCGLLAAEARRLNEAFVTWVTERRPFTTLKMAMTLDGKIATASGESQWITGERSRLFGHELRDRNDAIMVGIGTVLTDKPSLTTRLPGGNVHHPCRVVLDSHARTPSDAPFMSDRLAPVVIVVTEAAPKERTERLRALGAEIFCAGAGPKVELPLLMRHLAENNICSLLVEGGGTVHFSMLRARLTDKICAFIAPMMLGGREAPTAVGGEGFSHLADAVRLSDIEIETLDGDLCLQGYVVR